jgi:hypothetical protein
VILTGWIVVKVALASALDQRAIRCCGGPSVAL